nr:hypothetical protein BdHM001_35160 [Bdellovibrio sp. HM001]
MAKVFVRLTLNPEAMAPGLVSHVKRVKDDGEKSNKTERWQISVFHPYTKTVLWQEERKCSLSEAIALGAEKRIALKRVHKVTYQKQTQIARPKRGSLTV